MLWMLLEKRAGGIHIPLNLSFQLVQRSKLSFGPQAFVKIYTQCLAVQIAAEIQNKSFHRDMGGAI